jgi:hypothetical protein
LRPGISHASGMAPVALDEDAQAGRPGDVRNQAEVNLFLLELRSLLDMQFNELVESPQRQYYGFECARETSIGSRLLQTEAFGVAQGTRLRRGECTRHHAATQAANAKAR